MNATRAVLFVAAAAFAAQLLFPPWVRTIQEAGISQIRMPSTYDFVGRPPTGDNPWVGHEIDMVRLVLQLAASAALTGIGLGIASVIDRAVTKRRSSQIEAGVGAARR